MRDYRNSKNKNIQTSLLNFLQNQNSMEEKNKYFNRKSMRKEFF